jgi:hypothetical protein
MAEPISTVSPEALILVGSNNETLPEGSSATKLRSPATPTRMSVVGKVIAVPSAPAIGSTGSTEPLVSSWTTGLPPPSCFTENAASPSWRALMVETTCSVSELYSTSCWLIGSATSTLPSVTSRRWARTPAPASTGMATLVSTKAMAMNFGSLTFTLRRANVWRSCCAFPNSEASVAAGTSPEVTLSTNSVRCCARIWIASAT